MGGSLVVTPEDARALYSGLQFVLTSSPSATKASVYLAASIQDITDLHRDAAYDSFGGDIRTATVTFVNRDANNAVLCTAGPIQLHDPRNPKAGAASCTWTADVGGADSVQFTVGIVVGGNYIRNASEENAIVTVAKPLSGFVVGGGYLTNQASAGAAAGDAGMCTNWGFGVRTAKSGAIFPGGVTVTVVSNGRSYQIRSNAIDALTAKTRSGSKPGTASFSGLATIMDITDPAASIPVSGNYMLQITVSDYGDSGARDLIGITIWDGTGQLWFSSRWNGTRTVEQLLSGGNLAIR